MPDAVPNLSPEDWSSLLDALHYASDEVGWDLYDTRTRDFYDADERATREQWIAGWERLAKRIAPLASRDTSTQETAHAND
jgi:hypothetical protein